MSIPTLSNELYIEIFRHLDAKSLSEISLCCHRFYDLVPPIFYRTYVQQDYDYEPDPFIRTIFEKPHLSRYVKHFTGHGGVGIMASLPETHRSLIREGLLPNYFDHQDVVENWCEDAFVEESWDAVTAILLLNFASSLESITMLSYGDSEIVNGPDNVHINTVLRKMRELQDNSKSTIPCMAKVRKVHLQSDKSLIEIQIALILPFLRLKSVREVTVEQLGNHFGTDYDLFTGLPLHHHITDLSLKRCDIDDVAFRNFVQSFPSLKRFHLEHTGGYNERPPPVIGDHLAHLKHCLENLTIDAPFWRQSQHGGWIDDESDDEDDYEGSDLYDELPSMIGSLGQFQKLTKVKIACDILVRKGTCWDKPHHVEAFVKSLPPFLEHLAILSCRIRGVEAGLSLLSQKPAHLKTLKLTVCPSFRGERRWGTVTIESLEKMALEKGIKFAWEVLED